MQASFPIQFHFADIQFSFPNRTTTKEMVLILFQQEETEIEHINYIFCTDEYLLGLNQQYLSHDTLTDIITFHYHQKGDPVHSDVYISWDRVKDNAVNFKTTYRRELHRVIFHGALHLCGYKDKTTKDQKLMRQMEDKYLSMFL